MQFPGVQRASPSCVSPDVDPHPRVQGAMSQHELLQGGTCDGLPLVTSLGWLPRKPSWKEGGTSLWRGWWLIHNSVRVVVSVYAAGQVSDGGFLWGIGKVGMEGGGASRGGSVGSGTLKNRSSS